MNSSSKVGVGRTVLVGPVRYPELCERGRTLLLDEGFTLIENETPLPWEREDLLPLLAGADAAVCGVEEYPADMLELAPNLRIISRLGVGLDNIDLVAARSGGVDVVNVPGGNASAVAELAIGLMIAVLRKIPEMDRKIRDGQWDRYVGYELAGKTVALIGFGAIARLVAKRLRGFDVTLLSSDPYADPAVAADLGVRLAPLEEIVALADVVSVHAPHLPSTHHLVNAELLALMKPGAIVINTSRGGLVDETALAAALDSGHIAGAGLDVFELEPVTTANPLLQFESVVATMHAAADSAEAYDRIGYATARAIVDVFSGRTPENLAN
ncbi:phosphoglycerate dehydrogenase [Humidisolicoccus flavus]|uniref:phosphoglycerate dehydrogenase n=1 Tax=Humidisolicoccus flavus TaxID=3111414 RepID=UPI003248A26E